MNAKHMTWSLPFLLLLGACSGAETGTTDTPDDEPTAASDFAVVLATLNPSDQQTIQVLAYGEELIGVSEWRGAEFDPETPNSLLNVRDGSIADFYARVAGDGADANVFETIQAIEARSVGSTRDGFSAETQGFVDGAPSFAEGAPPDVGDTQTLALACAKTDAHYNAFSSGWAGSHCVNPPGWEDVWCRTNRPEIVKDWTHAEKWWVKFHNMSSCNTASGYVHAKRPGKLVGLGGPILGPNQSWSQWWSVTNRDWRFYTVLEHESGNEQAHLNMATYRMW